MQTIICLLLFFYEENIDALFLKFSRTSAYYLVVARQYEFKVHEVFAVKFL